MRLASAITPLVVVWCITGYATLHVPSPIQAAVQDASRPADDVARDTNRKPAETLAFAGIKRGDVVADYIANSG